MSHEITLMAVLLSLAGGCLALALLIGLVKVLHALFDADDISQSNVVPIACAATAQQRARGPACGDAREAAAARSLPDGNHGENNIG